MTQACIKPLSPQPDADTASDALADPADESDPAHHDDEPPSRHDADAAVQLSIRVDDQAPVPHADGLCDWLRSRLAEALERLAITLGSLDVVIVADPLMAELHEQYKRVPGTTDVLTFDLREGDRQMSEAHQDIDAEVVLCFDEAQRQAAERGHEPRQELLLYAVHGLMHLLDEDDDTEAAAAQMHRREDDLLEQMGQGRVYGTEPMND